MAEALVNSAVRVSALRKRYGKLTALETVDLAVAPGEAFGLVGANGAGKTTLIRCLLTLCASEPEPIRISGQPAGEPQSRRRLAYVPERFMPAHYLRCREFVEFLARSFGERYDAARAGDAVRAGARGRRARAPGAQPFEGHDAKARPRRRIPRRARPLRARRAH